MKCQFSQKVAAPSTARLLVDQYYSSSWEALLYESSGSVVRSTLLFFRVLGDPPGENPKDLKSLWFCNFFPKVTLVFQRLLEASRIIILEGFISFTGVVSNLPVSLQSVAFKLKMWFFRGPKIWNFQDSGESPGLPRVILKQISAQPRKDKSIQSQASGAKHSPSFSMS